MKNKGQMFLIVGVIVIVILISLKTTVNLPNIIQQKKEMEEKFEKDFFSNIASESVKVIEISYNQPNNITNNIFDFANFTRKKMNERLLDFSFFYVGSNSSHTESKMDVTIINLLGRPINVTLTLNDTQTDNRNDISDSSSWFTNFSITPGNDYILTILYDNQNQNVTIITDAQKDTYIGFFDIELTSLETTYKDKFQKSYTLP